MAKAPTPTIKPITARRKLELSRLSPSAVQREAMGDDVDLKAFVAYLQGKIETQNLEDRIISAPITRTVEGASTLQVVFNDYERTIFRSNLLDDKFDVQIDGLWFRLSEVDKQGDDLTLTFQDREIEILRTYDSWKIAQRGQLTRAEFVLSMIREVKEFDIPVVIPELHIVQPVEKYSGDLVGIDAILNKTQGIPADINSQTPKDVYNHRDTTQKKRSSLLTVKGAVATATQIQNANIVLAVGNEVGASRRLKVIALMTAIQESSITAIPDKAHGGNSDADSAGVYQQRPGWGSYLERMDVETSARLFYKAAIPVEAANDGEPYWFIAAETQHPREDLRTEYSKWRTEAERFVNASGDIGTEVTTANLMQPQQSAFGAEGPFYFYRGIIEDRRGVKIRKPENTWTCSQRLADEVDWRSFFVSGTYYLISEDDLFKQTPIATINEFTPGIQDFDCNLDKHKKAGVITITALVGRWKIPPGSVVVVNESGVFNGRWLVNEFSRDLVGEDRTATITLKKPRPRLPEPAPQGNASDINSTWAPTASANPWLPPTADLITQVLQNKAITFENVSQTSDIQLGQIYEPLLQFLMWFTGLGYTIGISALKSDHSLLTSEGNVSAHGSGKAVDINIISGIHVAENGTTSSVMDLLAQYQFQLQFDQLIGPFPLKCIPQGIYDSLTLSQHKNHIHVGWKI